MKFTEHTTSMDVLKEFNDSVLGLLDEVEERYEQGKKGGMTDQLLAVHTRKQILKWFFNNGGL